MVFIKKNVVIAVVALVVSVAIIAPVMAQSDVENRIRRLENEIQTLGRAVFRGDVQQAPSALGGGATQNQAVVANLSVRLNQMEAQLRDLTGLVEQQNFKIRQMEERLQQVSVLAQQSQAQNQQQYRAPQAQPPQMQPNAPYVNNTQSGQVATSQQAQSYTAQQMGQPHQLGSIRQNPDGEAVVNTQNPTYLYDTAFAMLQQGQYDASAKALNQFLNTYTDHPLASNAQYWLGETFYVRNNFEEAAKAFATGYQKYPKSSKAPDNLLKLALSLSNLNKNEEACVTLSQLKSEYPKASSSVVRKADEEKERLSCSNGD